MKKDVFATKCNSEANTKRLVPIHIHSVISLNMLFSQSISSPYHSIPKNHRFELD